MESHAVKIRIVDFRFIFRTIIHVFMYFCGYNKTYHTIPFKLWVAKEILAMVSGTDYIGIVPEKIIPVYCHSYFPKEGHILDFMNLL